MKGKARFLQVDTTLVIWKTGSKLDACQNKMHAKTGRVPKSMWANHLGKGIWGTPLRADHDIMAGLIPEVIPKLGFFICPASFYLTQSAESVLMQGTQWMPCRQYRCHAVDAMQIVQMPCSARLQAQEWSRNTLGHAKKQGMQTGACERGHTILAMQVGPCSLGAMHVGPCRWGHAGEAMQQGHADEAMHVGPCRWGHASGDLQMGPCRRGHAAGAMREGPCGRRHASGAMQVKPCRRGHADEAMHVGPCKWGHAGEAMQMGPCRRGHACGAMQMGPCKWGPADGAMQTGPCGRGHAGGAMRPAPCKWGHAGEAMQMGHEDATEQVWQANAVAC